MTHWKGFSLLLSKGSGRRVGCRQDDGHLRGRAGGVIEKGWERREGWRGREEVGGGGNEREGEGEMNEGRMEEERGIKRKEKMSIGILQ